jgi:hypothetical protein
VRLGDEVNGFMAEETFVIEARDKRALLVGTLATSSKLRFSSMLGLRLNELMSKLDGSRVTAKRAAESIDLA